MTKRTLHWSLCRRRFLALLGVVAVAGLSGCSVAAPEKGPLTFRVMSYNIHHGEGLDGKVDLERIGALIKAERADMVALQEVDKGVERTQRRDLGAELARLTGMTCVFSNNYHYQGGEYGNAVLTRFPVKSWTNTHYQMLREGEQRGLLQVTLDLGGRELRFWNTHIDHRPDDAERFKNMSEVRALFRQSGGAPVIVCGDFNDVPESRTWKAMAEMFVDSWTVAGSGDGFTIPAQSPRKRIDYIWVSKGSRIEALKVWVPDTQASDHRPLVAEVRWKGKG